MINLIVQTFSKQPLMQKIEKLLHSTYFFFSLAKRYFKKCKLAELLETKGNKMLHHINTKWISMLFPIKGASITSCPCWKSSMDLSSLLKVMLVLFMILLGF